MAKLQELQEKRTYNQKHFATDKPGVFVMNAHVGHIHYKKNGVFEEIDNHLTEVANGWEMKKASYHAFLPKYADEWFEFRNLYKEETDFTTKFRPVVNHVEGILTNTGEYANVEVVYLNVLPDIDMIVQTGKNSLRREFRINKNPGKKLEIPIEIETDKDIDYIPYELTDVKASKCNNIRKECKDKQIEEQRLAESGYSPDCLIRKRLQNEQLAKMQELENERRKVWDKKKSVETTLRLKFKNGNHFTQIHRPFVWDSSNLSETGKVIVSEKIKFRLESKNNVLRFIKLVPKKFLDKAIYPVFTDDSTNYYSGAGDGYCFAYTEGDQWNATHDATSATAYPTATNGNATECRGTEGVYTIGRGFFPFDTSGLSDEAVISEAIMYVCCKSPTSVYTGVVTVVQTTQAATDTLTAEDFDQCGAVDNPTEGTDSPSSSQTNNSYYAITLNATGRGWISKTGFTKLGQREKNHDCADSAPGNSNTCRLQQAFSEYADTSSDPYLSITYTVPLTKTLTEVVKAGGTIIKGTQKVLSSALAVVSQRASTLYKTFVESIINSDARVASFYKTLTEAILASDTFSKIQNLTRTLSESLIIKDAREKILTAYKTLIENIKASDLYEKSASLFKLLSEALTTSDLSVTIQRQFLLTFTEVVQVIDKISFTTTRIFQEAIKVILDADPVMIRIKGLYETIIVSGSHVFDTTRQFVEKVYVGARKLTYRAFSFFENLIVVPVFGKLQTKRLLEYVKAFDVIIPNKMQRAILTDAFKVVSGFTRSLSRNFFEIINVVGNIASKTTRIFTEAISVTTNFVGLFGHVLWERLTVAGSLASWAIGKVIVQTINVVDSVGKASAWSMSEVLKVAGNLVVIANKILVEIVNVGMSIRFAMGRVITHIIRVGNIKVFRHIFYTIKTESLKVLDTIVHGTSRIFNEVVIAIGAIGSWSIAKLFIEPVKVVASFLRTWTLSRVFTEVIKGGSEAYQQSIKIFRETINVISSTVIPVPAKVFYETLKIVQNITKSLPKTFEEFLSITGNMLNQTGKTFVEAINVVGTYVLGTISKVFIERVKIVQGFITGGTFYKTFTEIIKVTGNGFNRAGKIFTETVIASGTFILGTISKMLIETIKIIQKYNVTMSRVFTHTISVVAGLTNRWGRIFGEIINVSEAFTRSIGRLFTEHIGIDWGKIKLVLNGIQVGLWKKVARVTNGLWRKISRNDTL